MRQRSRALTLVLGATFVSFSAASCSSGKPFSGASPDEAGAPSGEAGSDQAGSAAGGGGSGGAAATGGALATGGNAVAGQSNAAGVSSDAGGAAAGGEAGAGATECTPGSVGCNPAAPLDGKRLELPCVGPDGGVSQLCQSVADRATKCPVGGKLVKQTVVLEGQPGTLYSVTLRIRGVVEPHAYVGGKDAGDHFYVGGAGQQPSNYNTFSVSVSAPAQTFFLNADTKPESYRVFVLDHQKTIVVEGGASVTLQVVDPDCAMVRNCQSFASAECKPNVIPDVPPAPQGYDGQFVQLDVSGVVLSK